MARTRSAAGGQQAGEQADGAAGLEDRRVVPVGQGGHGQSDICGSRTSGCGTPTGRGRAGRGRRSRAVQGSWAEQHLVGPGEPLDDRGRQDGVGSGELGGEAAHRLAFPSGQGGPELYPRRLVPGQVSTVGEAQCQAHTR